MKPKAIAKKKTAAPKLVTPVGRLSYPYLANPDTGRENSDEKYKTDLLIPKKVWKTEGKALREAVLQVGRTFFNDKNLQLEDFKNPFKDIDSMEKYSNSDAVKDCILIRCKSEFTPAVVGPDKQPLSEAEIAKIKGGDYARLVVAVYPYNQQGGGVTLGLNLVQFVRPGESLGGGMAANLAMIDEMEVEADDITPEEDDENEEDNEDEKPLPKKSGKGFGKKKSLPTDEDDAEDVSEDDEESDEDEEEAPKKSKKAPAKAAPKKAKKVADEEESDDDEDGDFDFDDDEAA